MIHKIFMIVGLIYSPMQLVASQANANAAASANASAAATSVVGAEADAKRGATTSAISEAERKKGYVYTDQEMSRIEELLAKSTFDEFHAALVKGEITPNQWVLNEPILTRLIQETTQPDKIALLIERGANVHEPDALGILPLFRIPRVRWEDRFATILRAFYRAAQGQVAFDAPYGNSNVTIFHKAPVATFDDSQLIFKYIELLIKLGADLEERGIDDTKGSTGYGTPLEWAVFHFDPGWGQQDNNYRGTSSIEALVASGADTQSIEGIMRKSPYRKRHRYTELISEMVKKGQERFQNFLRQTREEQLLALRGQLRATFQYVPNAYGFETVFAPLINDYAGRLNRTYTYAEKLVALDEVVAAEEEAEKPKS